MKDEVEAKQKQNSEDAKEKRRKRRKGSMEDRRSLLAKESMQSDV